MRRVVLRSLGQVCSLRSSEVDQNREICCRTMEELTVNDAERVELTLIYGLLSVVSKPNASSPHRAPCVVDTDHDVAMRMLATKAG